MSLRPVVAATAVALLTFGCGSRAAPTDDTAWIGTITTEGDVTTVINESGSVWGGTARLVEEAPIGVESGADEYMLGLVTAVAADDQRIYVVEPSRPAVRMYDHSGAFVGILGGEGQGPGEYLTPILVAAADDGRVFVYQDSRRINVYAPDGTPAETWPISNLGCCAWPMLMSPESDLWVPVVEWGYQREVGDDHWGVQRFTREGLMGAAVRPPENLDNPGITHDAGGRESTVPFAASVPWGVSGPGSMAAGASDQYRFEVHKSDGSMLVIERYWEPIPIAPEHREWTRLQTIGRVRESLDPSWSWDGAEMPTHQPAFRTFIATVSGEIWVVRPGESRHHAGCIEDPLQARADAVRANPCWTTDRIVDAFAADGRYLGEVEVPEGLPTDNLLQMGVFVRGRMVVAVVEDEAGTIRVKRYRLVPPPATSPDSPAAPADTA